MSLSRLFFPNNFLIHCFLLSFDEIACKITFSEIPFYRRLMRKNKSKNQILIFLNKQNKLSLMNFFNFFIFLLIFIENAQMPEGAGGGASSSTKRLGGPSQGKKLIEDVKGAFSHVVEGAKKKLHIGEKTADELLEKWANQVSKKSFTDLQKEFKIFESIQSVQTNIFKANSSKNRYMDVHLLESTRVKLSGDNYIHANYITNAGIGIICTQGPIGEGEIATKSNWLARLGIGRFPKLAETYIREERDTTGDFWQMVVEQNVDAIVMVTDTKEGNTPKCAQYWPLEKEDAKHSTFGKYKINFISQQHFHENIVKTELEVVHGAEEKHKVAHFHWRGWPDYGAPGDSEAPFKLWDALLKDYKNVVVHCSAGIGRTGTIVAIQLGQQWMQTGKPLSIRELVEKLRTERIGSVQKPSQYFYIYKVFLAEAKRRVVEKKIKLSDRKMKAIENLMTQLTSYKGA